MTSLNKRQNNEDTFGFMQQSDQHLQNDEMNHSGESDDAYQFDPTMLANNNDQQPSFDAQSVENN